jgi:hypothetical protein
LHAPNQFSVKIFALAKERAPFRKKGIIQEEVFND